MRVPTGTRYLLAQRPTLHRTTADESELITKLRDAATKRDIPKVLDEQGQFVRWDVHPDSLVGEMRGYTIEEAENEFRNKEFKTHVIASYQTASHKNYDKSDGSMRRITHEEVDILLRVNAEES